MIGFGLSQHGNRLRGGTIIRLVDRGIISDISAGFRPGNLGHHRTLHRGDTRTTSRKRRAIYIFRCARFHQCIAGCIHLRTVADKGLGSVVDDHHPDCHTNADNTSTAKRATRIDTVSDVFCFNRHIAPTGYGRAVGDIGFGLVQ